MAFASTSQYKYQSGDFFLGLDELNQEIGIRSPRHAITIAGARSGKGTCVIIPNLFRWPHNTLVIDPKGDNAEASWEKREALGSKVYVIDPFQVADVPDRLRAAFNPLQNIDPESLTGAADLQVIADGLVKRTNPEHAQWDDGAVTLLSGIMAYVITEGGDVNGNDSRTLKSVRDILLLDRDDLYAEAQAMKQCEAFDGIAQDAGNIIMTAVESEKSIEEQFISNAKGHVQWINLRAMRNVLEKSTFSLAELKNGKASVFVVLPPEYLETHSAFLRLFVRSAINVMAKGGSGKGEKCLFFLDEFFSLGKIDIISKSAGLMPSFGVHLWPILQDLGQLVSLYGREGSQTFFGNADLHQFFGNTDQETLNYISARLGENGLEVAPIPPKAPKAFTPSASTPNKDGSASWGQIFDSIDASFSANAQAQYQDEMNNYNQAMQKIGKPRYTPNEVAKMVQRKDDVIADHSINFIYGSEALKVSLAAHFRKYLPIKKEEAYQPTNDDLTLAQWVEVSFIIGGFALLTFLMLQGRKSTAQFLVDIGLDFQIGHLYVISVISVLVFVVLQYIIALLTSFTYCALIDDEDKFNHETVAEWAAYTFCAAFAIERLTL